MARWLKLKMAKYKGIKYVKETDFPHLKFHYPGKEHLEGGF
jgi:hypothetical protein